MIDETVKRITINKSFGGAGQGNYTNVYNVAIPGALDEAALVHQAEELAKVEQKYEGSQVFFSTATIQYYNGKNNAGVKSKPYSVPLGFFGYKNLQDVGNNDNEPLGTTTYHKVLPAEVVLALAFAAGLAGVGIHTYRHAISEGDWQGTGRIVEMKQVPIDFVTNQWHNFLEQNNGACPLVMISGKGNAAFAAPITKISVLGARNRQLENRRTGKKGNFDAEKETPEEGQEKMAQVIDILQEVENDRFGAKGAAFFQSAGFLGAVGTLAIAAKAIQDSRATNDFGPKMLAP